MLMTLPLKITLFISSACNAFLYFHLKQMILLLTNVPEAFCGNSLLLNAFINIKSDSICNQLNQTY